MTFDYPELVGLALVLPLVLALAVWLYARRRRRVARRLGAPELLGRLGAGGLEEFPTRRLLLVGIAAAALGVAAAGPRWGLETVQDRSASLDLVLALDVSKSMLARDVPPNRLERMRVLARRLLRELPADRIGLVAFAGRGYVLSPMTVDHSALQLFLDALDPDIVSRGGSSLAAGLQQATDLARGGDEARGGAVVLISDGEALEEVAQVQTAAARAARLDVVVHTVGVGSREGAPVPEWDPVTNELSGYKRGPDGQVVISRLDEALLRDIADRTGGRYVRLDEAGATNRLLAAIRGMDRTIGPGERRVERKARAGWFVGLALLLLAADAVLARRQRAGGPGAAPWRALWRRHEGREERRAA